MKKLLLFVVILFSCVTSLIAVIQTDYAIFLFDNGEKNMVASMIKYAQKHDKTPLENLNFRIVFMGAALDAISQEPFCNYSNKLIHYKKLGINETIDRTWKRGAKISQTSIENLHNNLQVQKKVFVGVSCSVFGQILQKYQTDEKIEAIALRDNPNLQGDTDYFQVAQQVQAIAKKIVVSSAISAQDASCKNKEIAIVGHAPTEELQEAAEQINKKAITKQLGLDSQLPIIVYGGTYGDYYEKAFTMFLYMLQNKKLALLRIQVVIVPHPRYGGSIEKGICQNFRHEIEKFLITINSPGSHTSISIIEALAIADAVVTADATSTIVTQAKSLSKDVFYINPTSSMVSQQLVEKGIITKISNTEEFIKAIQGLKTLHSEKDIFDLFCMPKNGAQLLWQQLIH